MVSAAISAVLQITEPIALPYAISPWPLTADPADTMTSGRVVPIDTTVAPIRISGTWNRRAMPTAPSTNQSPPLMSRRSPSPNSSTVQKSEPEISPKIEDKIELTVELTSFLRDSDAQNDLRLERLVKAVALHVYDLIGGIHAFSDLAERSVLAI